MFPMGCRALLAMAAVSALTVAGCATNTEDSGAPTTSVSVSKDPELAAKLPPKIAQAGKLVVGVNLPYAPNEFKNEQGAIVGFDVDLVNAVAQVLGITADYRESDFEKIIPSIQGGTYDIGMSSFTDSGDREKQVDFVDYFQSGVLWAAPAGKTVDPNNACGLRVAVETGTVEDTQDVPARSAKCTAAGKAAIDKQKFDRQDDATNALVLGKVDAMSADSSVTAYAVKLSGGKIQTVGQIFDAAPYGWPVAKGSPLGPLLQRALQKLIDDGTYKAIATNWGVQAGMIPKAAMNGAGG